MEGWRGREGRLMRRRVCVGGEGKGGVGCFRRGMLWKRRGGEGRGGVFAKTGMLLEG
jgi:hypothetical protein